MVKQGVSRLVTIKNRENFQKARQYLSYRNGVLGVPGFKTDAGALEAMVDLVLKFAEDSGWQGEQVSEIERLHVNRRLESQDIERLSRHHSNELRRMGELGRRGDWEAVKRIQAQLPELQEKIHVSIKRLQETQDEIYKAREAIQQEEQI